MQESVARSLGRQRAFHQAHVLDLQGPEWQVLVRFHGLYQVLDPARGAYPADRQVRVERLGVGINPRLFCGFRDFVLQSQKRLQVACQAGPDRPGRLRPAEITKAFNFQRAGAISRRDAIGGGGKLRRLRFEYRAQEEDCEMDIDRRHPADVRARLF